MKLSLLQIELTDMVYRKAMQLSGAEVACMGIGGIANLQSNDVQKMSRFRLDINPLWDAPFQASAAYEFRRQRTSIDAITCCGNRSCASTNPVVINLCKPTRCGPNVMPDGDHVLSLPSITTACIQDAVLLDKS